MEVNAIGATGTVDATDDMWRDAEIVLAPCMDITMTTLGTKYRAALCHRETH